MRSSSTTALIVSGLLALGLSACGSGSDDDTSTNATSTPAATSTPKAADTETEAASNGRLTPPDTKLGFGETATVGWVPPSTYDAAGGQKGYKLEITVDGIEKGTIDDFKNVNLETEQKDATPYYVKVTIKTLEDEKLDTDDPDISLKAIDDRGQEQGSVTFFGEFERCRDGSVPKPFTAGKSYESCLTYLVPGGGSIESVEWNNGPSEPEQVTEYFSNPVVWSGS